MYCREGRTESLASSASISTPRLDAAVADVITNPVSTGPFICQHSIYLSKRLHALELRPVGVGSKVRATVVGPDLGPEQLGRQATSLNDTSRVECSRDSTM